MDKVATACGLIGVKVATSVVQPTGRLQWPAGGVPEDFRPTVERANDCAPSYARLFKEVSCLTRTAS